MLHASDYQTPGGHKDLPHPEDIPEPNVPPVGDPDKGGPGSRPGDSPDNDIKLPDSTDEDMAKDHPDPEDSRPGRRDDNILEDEQIYDD